MSEHMCGTEKTSQLHAVSEQRSRCFVVNRHVSRYSTLHHYLLTVHLILHHRLQQCVEGKSDTSARNERSAPASAALGVA